MEVIKRKGAVLTLEPISKQKSSKSKKKIIFEGDTPNKKQQIQRPAKRTSILQLKSNSSVEKITNKALKQPQMGESKKKTQVRSLYVSRRGNRNFYIMQNQDYIHIDQANNNYRLYIIMDGHGKYGRLLAEAAANKIASKYTIDIRNAHKQNQEYTVESVMKNVIAEANNYLMSTYAKEVANSGCTLLCVLIQDEQVYCFNVGCSRAVLAMKLKQSGKMTPFPLSTDQNLGRFDQKHRIAQTEAVIEQLKDEDGCRVGPQRIWKKNQKYPGIFITRSLGMRLSAQLGIIAEPEWTYLRIQPKFQFVLAASDGFWEVFSSQQAVQFLASYWSEDAMAEGMQKLLNETVRRWEHKRQLMDDISILIIKI